MSDADQRLADRRAAVDEGDDHAQRHQAMLRCRAGECCGHALGMPKGVAVHIEQVLRTNEPVGGPRARVAIDVRAHGLRGDVDRFRMWLTALLESKP